MAINLLSVGACSSATNQPDNWSIALADGQYSTFEDPFSGMPVPKTEFNEVYGPACREVFQCGITVGLLFVQNPVVYGEWRFADDDARADLYDAAVELGLVPKCEEICAGETNAEKACRVAFEATLRAQREFGGPRKPSGLEIRGGILSRGRKVRNGVKARTMGADDTDVDDGGVVFEAVPKLKKTMEELKVELDKVMAEFERSGLSNKRLKKLERRRRGILSALEKSDEGIASETAE